ncbi:MAG: condensation domain-containing protein, partial [Pyrinomonadaceae bacterium]
MSSNSKLTAPLSTQEKRALLAKALRKRVAAPKSYPASFAQRRLWFLYHLEPDSPLYNIAAAIRLNGRLDVHALRQALGEVVRRHDALRTTFALADGSPVQVVSPTLELPVPLTDLCTLPADAREGEVARRARAEAETPFDLGAGPLLRVGLLAFGACEHVMLLTMHHIVSDAWSMDVLVRELTTLYKAFCEGAPSPLPELPIQYADYARWQHKWLTGEVLERQMDYWKRQLRAAPVMALPTDRPRPLVRSSRGGHHAFHLPPPLAEAIRALGAAHNATPFMTLLAAFTSLLHRYTQQEEVVVGCPIAGRNRKETEGLIGFFVNTLVLRVDAVGDPTFGELLARVRETALGAYAHQDLPFEMLVEKLQPERRLGHTPLFQVAFVMQSRDESAAAAVDGLTFGSVPVENNFAKFDLTLAIAETQRGLRASFEYSTELYDAETVARMAGHLRVLLEGAVSNPGCRLSELPLLTEAERLRLPAVRNAHAAARPQAKCLPELFAEQARRTPGAVAVVDERTQLTYAQLDARADRLAHRLRTLGVAPDTLVALCLERSCLMVVA